MVEKRKEHLGKELFIAGYDGDVEVGELAMFDSLFELNDHLSSMSPISETNLTVIHGILTSAEYIPEKIGRYVYVVALDPYNENSGCIFEHDSEDADKLAELIEGILSSPPDDLGDLEIDNIFILYGYEISLCYAVCEDDVDEEIIETSQEVADVANEMREKISSTEE